MLHIENRGHYSIIKEENPVNGCLKVGQGYGALAYSKAGNSTFGKTGLETLQEALDYADKMNTSNPNSNLEPYFLDTPNQVFQPTNKEIQTMNKTLTGHTNPETAYLVEDYPYGFRLRTQIRYWIDTTKNGQRFISQTLNPKTGAWNKPKAGTYSQIKTLTLNPDNNHVESASLDYNDDESKITAFETNHPEAVDERARKVIKHLRAHNAAMSKITWHVGPANDDEVHQTREEQMAIINALTRVELAKAEQ